MPILPVRDVVAQSLSWLWPDRIPLGKLSILDGDPDLGKSLLTLDLAARLSTGRPFPDGRPSPGPANALILSAEDSAHDTISPRLAKLGADLDRVFVWARGNDAEPWPWRFPADAAKLGDALEFSDARLAVIDPIMAFLDNSVLCATDQSVRRMLAPLIFLAEKHRCAMILLRHLSKHGGHRAAYRGLGSIGFVAASRFAMLVGRDPLAPQGCVLAHVRNSLGTVQPSLAYQITSTDGGMPQVQWKGTSPCLADELLGIADPDRDQRTRAMLFLEHMLASGPCRTRDIWDAAQKIGLSERTLRRARDAMNLKKQRNEENGHAVYYWLRQDQDFKHDPTGFDNFLRELEARFPTPPPIDDREEDEGPVMDIRHLNAMFPREEE